MPHEVGAARLASAEGYTPRATQLLEAARERLGTIQEVAGWIAENLPQPKTGPSRSRRRRRRKKKAPAQAAATEVQTAEANGDGAQPETERPEPAEPRTDQPPKKRRRRRKKPAA